MNISVTYNITKAMHKGVEGYKPVVRGKAYDALFYRTVERALKSAEAMADAEAKTLRGHGHDAFATLDETLGLIRK